MFRQAEQEAPDDPALCAHAEQELAFARLVADDLPATNWAPLVGGQAGGELGKIATRPVAGGLTDTERRTAALVAQGLTNRQIASAMFVTENTVQTHIRHIFQRLSV